MHVFIVGILITVLVVASAFLGGAAVLWYVAKDFLR
jgi:hypothetical protein